jgi:membrane protease YdiL (CAAX protease family)
VSLPVAIGLQLGQSGVLFAIVILIGLRLGGRVGLGAPLLPEWLRGGTPAGWGGRLRQACALGGLAGAVVFVLDRYVFGAFTAPVTAAQAAAPWWTRLLASFYGGIAEELFMRLGLMTLIVWITWKIKADADGNPTSTGVWTAILLASLVFGLGHLPANARTMGVEITSVLVVQTAVLNMIAGVLFGWLYWKRGLEAAVTAHFSADIVLHVLLPSFTRGA